MYVNYIINFLYYEVLEIVIFVIHSIIVEENPSCCITNEYIYINELYPFEIHLGMNNIPKKCNTENELKKRNNVTNASTKHENLQVFLN